MRILFLSDNFPPEVNAPATRTYEHCAEWVKLGTEVTVITTQPNFPHGRIYEGYSNRLYQKENIDGITVIRVGSYITANEGFIKRTLDYLSFSFMAGLVGIFQRTDLIVATSPQFFTTWAGCFLGFIKRKPWVFELRDLWPESIVTVGAMKKGRLYKLLESIELFLYRNADFIIPNTPAFKKNLIQRGISDQKISVIPNGANLELYSPREKNRQLIERLGLNGKFVVGYIGTHGMAHSLDFIVESIAHVQDPDIHYLFVGDGANKSNVVKLSESINLKNITFLPSVTKEVVPDYLSILDVALVPLKKSDTFKTVIPSKIFESGAMGIPILLGVDGQVREIVETHNAGVYFEPESRDEFLSALQRLKNDKALFASCSKGGLELANAYDRKKLAIEMLELLKTIQ